ncbi:MAG: ABC-F family ATP-binding cassette domain-containing protein [Elusimicrobia bacterium]|nr:ABC-F family ATP-binding cassette domain-containing protein [Elusimicrobiota bacterium]
MSIFLSCQNLSKSFGHRPLFDNLSFGLFEGERTGLIGPNGAGKSTLLKILAGLETPDSGSLSPRRGLRVGYLPQQDRFDAVADGWTVRDELTRALQGLGLEDYEIDMRLEAGLDDAGFQDHAVSVATLSGGWRKRLAILAQVVREPDLLLLDEPTNHLDLEGVLWLEKFLSGLRFSFLTVTHDRLFLERVANRVIELDRRHKDGFFSSKGNYSAFLEKRETLLADQASQQESLGNVVRTEIAWLRRNPKAQTIKHTARVDRAGELMGDLAELKFRNSQDKAVDIDFSGSGRQTRRLVEAKGVAKSLGGRRLFGPLDLALGPGEKLGLLGENGSGKSTLLRMLAGELAPDAGAIKHAERLEIVTFDQHRDRLDLSTTLRRALCPNGEHVYYRGKATHVAGWATRFLFRHEQLDKPLSELSGGEQSRVLIATLMLKSADLLLLDEPTNDLDIRSLETLEASMMDFPGALVLVTHDRYLLERVCQRILALDGKGGADYFADLSQWENRKAAEKGSPTAPAAAPKPALTPNEAKELKGMETAIQLAERQAQKARLALEDPAVAADAAELAKRHKAVDDAHSKVDALFARWQELEARA